ncbi:MAG: CvpA family protein [Clostridia bacterium]|nr:CvpA family protein [Clostridia bacterium]
MKEKLKSLIFPTVITLPFMAVYYYFGLPALNLRAADFWVWLIISAGVFAVCYFSWNDPGAFQRFIGWLGVEAKGGPKKKTKRPSTKDYYSGAVKPDTKRRNIILIAIAAVLGVILLVIFCTSAPLFRAEAYQKMLTVKEDSDFSKDIAELPLSQIPVVDRDTAERLGNRKMGEVYELVSQFDVSSYYSQINYKNKPYRVSPLQYAGFLKWMANTDNGIPYYVTIDMATQSTELVELDEGMKYSPSEFFARDLKRHIRSAYPTKMFENLSFEIDDSGAPYWVMSYYGFKIGLFGGKDIAGVILVNAVTGEMTDYPISEVPQWIDLAYSPELVIAQANNWGSYKNGFWNSVFVQKNVVVTTEGYNYIAVDDDVWLYTGITSVSSDESNVGFILINMRTKEAKTYMINGAEEYSAMESAEGQIQEKSYTATFPILLNIADRPSYFISLKDNAGLVKAYAFVSVANYQIVGVADTIDGAAAEYRRMLGVENGTGSGNVTEYEGTVSEIATAVVGGNSVYYIRIGDKIYTAEISVSHILPFLTVGETVKFSATADGKITAITRKS